VGRDLPPPGAPVSSPRPPTYCSYAKHNQDGKGSMLPARNGPCTTAFPFHPGFGRPMRQPVMTSTTCRPARPVSRLESAAWSRSSSRPPLGHQRTKRPLAGRQQRLLASGPSVLSASRAPNWCQMTRGPGPRPVLMSNDLPFRLTSRSSGVPSGRSSSGWHRSEAEWPGCPPARGSRIISNVYATQKRWGWFGSNSRPADYEKYGLLHYARCLHR
jgi:hypothetical protein